MTASTDIHIVLTFDDDFWAPAYALMRSICLTTRRRTDLKFHLCIQGLGDRHRSDLDAIGPEFGAELIYYDLTDSEAFRSFTAPLKLHRRFPPVTYARLMLDRILPKHVERVIYLDCDTFVLHPIERLYDIDMGGMPIAAVQDPMALYLTMGRDLRGDKKVFDPADPYFNSGVLLIDVKAFADTNIGARLDQLREQAILDRLYYDQDILNLIFLNRWLALEWRFNAIDPFRSLHASGPHIVHYTGDNRPWHLVGLVPYRRTYRHAMTNELFYRFMRHRWKRSWQRLGRRLTGRA